MGRSGGVSIYVRNSLPSRDVPFSFASETIEICSAAIRFNSDELFVFAVYRPHSGTVYDFSDVISGVLCDAMVVNKPAIVAGDINSNILNSCPQPT